MTSTFAYTVCKICIIHRKGILKTQSVTLRACDHRHHQIARRMMMMMLLFECDASDDDIRNNAER
jgi:hypothetical protein